MKVVGLVEGMVERMFQAEESICVVKTAGVPRQLEWRWARCGSGGPNHGFRCLILKEKVRSLLSGVVRKEYDLSWKGLSQWNFSAP